MYEAAKTQQHPRLNRQLGKVDTEEVEYRFQLQDAMLTVNELCETYKKKIQEFLLQLLSFHCSVLNSSSYR